MNWTVAHAVNLTSADNLLGQTALLAAGEFRCPSSYAQFAGGDRQRCHLIAFPRNPVRIRLHGALPELAGPGMARLYNVGDLYDRIAVDGRADNSDWIALSPRVLDDLLAMASLGGSGSLSKLFPMHATPIRPWLSLMQRQLFRQTKLAGPGDLLGFEESTVTLASGVLREAARFWRRAPPKRVPRSLPERRRRDIVEETKEILALDPALDLSLEQIAARVYCSAGHLARVFRQHTGRSLHTFRQQVRLHHALDLITDGGSDLADVAAQAGYASHSHMSSDFRRQFHVLPSAYRVDVAKSLPSRTIRTCPDR